MDENPDDVVRFALSESIDAETAAQDLARQLMHPHLGCVLFFCSAEYALPALATALNQYFGGVRLIGCTTAGEITPLGYGRGCISAVGFDHRAFSISTARVDALDSFNLLDAQHVVAQLVDECRSSCLDPVVGRSFALTLLDGLSSREELVLSALNAAFGRIPHFGGSAADDKHLTRTHVYHEGYFHTGAAVVVLIQTSLEFEVFTTHHIQPLDEKMVVTAANPATRTVQELNAEPAALEYARWLGLDVSQLNFQVFALHPLAVRIGGQYYVRSIQRVNPDLSLTFYCAVENGIVLTAMQPGPLLPNLEQLFGGLEQRLGPLLLTIGCDCFLRRMEIEARGIIPETANLLVRHRVIGFNTYGEQFNGMHINQTFTGVAIGRSHRGLSRNGTF